MRRLRQTIVYLAIGLILEGGRIAVRLLPRRFFLILSAACADLGFYLFHGFRKRSSANLSIALGDRLDRAEISAIVRSSLRNFFRDFIEIGFALEGSPEQIRREMPVCGSEHLEAALARGKGVIALSAHLGNFFLAGTRLAAEGYSTHILVHQPRNRKVAQLLDRYRLEGGQKTIPARPRNQASRELARVLRRNEVAVVIADEYRSGSGIQVPFFARTVIARRGPATLALRTGAALVPVCLLRQPSGTLMLRIEPEIELVRTGNTQRDVGENTLRITEWVERTVRSHPDQWNWMTVHWQDGPRGASAEKSADAKAWDTHPPKPIRQAETK